MAEPAIAIAAEPPSTVTEATSETDTNVADRALLYQQVLDMVPNPHDQPQAIELMDKILDEGEKLRAIVEIQRKESEQQIEELKERRQDWTEQMEQDMSTLPERLEGLRHLKDISRQVSRLQRVSR
jgi:uncharacterized protein Yka (UPF0111/DUF47 family)